MFIVGVGGTLRPESTSEIALRMALEAAAERGAEVEAFCGERLRLPYYEGRAVEPEPNVRALVEALRRADGVIVASPGYHGSISGLVKNALDCAEDLAQDARPYLDQLPVGCIAVAYGAQAAVSTLSTLRTIAHALRGWPTPFGAAIQQAPGMFGPGAVCHHGPTRDALRLVGRQVFDLASSLAVTAAARGDQA